MHPNRTFEEVQLYQKLLTVREANYQLPAGEDYARFSHFILDHLGSLDPELRDQFRVHNISSLDLR